MSTPHTPGPWKVGAGSWRSDGELYLTILAGNECVATAWEGNAKANARLMALAPEMYALLRGYLTTYPLDSYADTTGKLLARATGTEVTP